MKRMDILSDKIVITRKKHVCCACGRLFEKGTKMRTQVNTLNGIQTWRECPTCQILLDKHRSHFEDDYDNVCYTDCVSERLDHGQTPEELLSALEISIKNKAVWVSIEDKLPPEKKWIIQLDHLGKPKLHRFDKVSRENMMPKIFPYWLEIPEPPCL